jgi:hypothetical protein
LDAAVRGLGLSVAVSPSFMTYSIRPDRPIEAVSNVGRLAVAGE